MNMCGGALGSVAEPALGFLGGKGWEGGGGCQCEGRGAVGLRLPVPLSLSILLPSLCIHLSAARNTLAMLLEINCWESPGAVWGGGGEWRGWQQPGEPEGPPIAPDKVGP